VRVDVPRIELLPATPVLSEGRAAATVRLDAASDRKSSAFEADIEAAGAGE
jgi:hypothetical protein